MKYLSICFLLLVVGCMGNDPKTLEAENVINQKLLAELSDSLSAAYDSLNVERIEAFYAQDFRMHSLGEETQTREEMLSLYDIFFANVTELESEFKFKDIERNQVNPDVFAVLESNMIVATAWQSEESVRTIQSDTRVRLSLIDQQLVIAEAWMIKSDSP